MEMYRLSLAVLAASMAVPVPARSADTSLRKASADQTYQRSVRARIAHRYGRGFSTGFHRSRDLPEARKVDYFVSFNARTGQVLRGHVDTVTGRMTVISEADELLPARDVKRAIRAAVGTQSPIGLREVIAIQEYADLPASVRFITKDAGGRRVWGSISREIPRNGASPDIDFDSEKGSFLIDFGYRLRSPAQESRGASPQAQGVEQHRR